MVLRNGTGGTVSFRPNLDTKRLMRVNYDHVFGRGIVDLASMFLYFLVFTCNGEG